VLCTLKLIVAACRILLFSTNIFFPLFSPWDVILVCMYILEGCVIYLFLWMQFSPVGHYFASSSHDRTARIWSMDRIQPLRIMAGHLSDVDVSYCIPYSLLLLFFFEILFFSGIYIFATSLFNFLITHRLLRIHIPVI